jgi:phosphatidylglycerol:prolipoprotein diacylglycerol transferase
LNIVLHLLAVITIGIDPTIEIGPLTLAWHGIMIAVGILAGGLAAARYARERGLEVERLYTIGLILAVSGLVGGRLFYLAEHGELLDPSEWLGTTGFTFNGGFILAAVATAVYLRAKRLTVGYLDVVAAGFPLGVAVGRIGDVINGEHYGPPSDFFLAVRNTHPDALVPSTEVAYHSGGLYEVLLASAIFALVWPLRHRLRRPLAMVWVVVALFAVGRFFEFFYRSDSDHLALGLNSAQWTSLALLAAAVVGAAVTARRQFGSRQQGASPSHHHRKGE